MLELCRCPNIYGPDCIKAKGFVKGSECCGSDREETNSSQFVSVFSPPRFLV